MSAAETVIGVGFVVLMAFGALMGASGLFAMVPDFVSALARILQ